MFGGLLKKWHKKNPWNLAIKSTNINPMIPIISGIDENKFQKFVASYEGNLFDSLASTSKSEGVWSILDGYSLETQWEIIATFLEWEKSGNETHERLQEIVNNTPNVVFEFDIKGNIQDSNIHEGISAGLSQEVGSSLKKFSWLKDLFSAGDQKMIFDKIKFQDFSSIEPLLILDKFFVKLQIYKLWENNYIGILTDITDTIKLLNIVKDALKMLRHDLNNPMSQIISFSEIILSKVEENDSIFKFIKNINNISTWMYNSFQILWKYWLCEKIFLYQNLQNLIYIMP